VTNTGGWQTWVSTTVATSTPATGAHKLYLVFTGPASQDFANIHWFQFATTPTGGGTISPSAWYEIVNQSGGGCIDATGWATTAAQPSSSGRAARASRTSNGGSWPPTAATTAS
jgi:Carbohydrate binding module (family 6)